VQKCLHTRKELLGRFDLRDVPGTLNPEEARVPEHGHTLLRGGNRKGVRNPMDCKRRGRKPGCPRTPIVLEVGKRRHEGGEHATPDQRRPTQIRGAPLQ